jgi:hypothetical protein
MSRSGHSPVSPLGYAGKQRWECRASTGGCGLRTTKVGLIDHHTPDGFRTHGVSTLYDSTTGQKKIEWHKISADKARQEEMFREALDEMAKDLPRIEPTPAPTGATADKMCVYPVGDHHIGMLSWHEETGKDYDLEIAERLLSKAIDHLVQITPACERALLLFMGDLMHYDGYAPVTAGAGNLLDADGRFPKMVRTTIRVVRRAITSLLDHHATVEVVFEPGNHDPASTVFLTEMMAALYENEPRVIIDTSPRNFHYIAFGTSLIGTHHGDKRIKMEQLPIIMATDMPTEWGASKHRYIWTGHLHHDIVKDYHGCRVESVRILPPADAWAAKSGYRSPSDMKAVVLDIEHGEVQRHTVNPAMLGE